MKRQVPTQLWINKGATVTNDGRDYVVLSLADINLVLAKDIESGERVLLKIGDLGPPRRIEDPKPAPPIERELLDVPDEMWAIAQARRQWIDPLLVSYQHHGQALASEIATHAEVDRATVYRWVAAFRETGLLSSLLPNIRRRGGKNGSRILPEVEALILETLEKFHDTQQQQTIAETVIEIRRRCSNAGLPLPAMNTIRARLERTDGRERTRRRAGPAAAHDQHDPVKGVLDLQLGSDRRDLLGIEIRGAFLPFNELCVEKLGDLCTPSVVARFQWKSRRASGIGRERCLQATEERMDRCRSARL